MDEMEDIIERFQELNFSRIESIVYFTLVKQGELNGSQISKYSKIPRSSVYPALEKLYSKGAVLLLPSSEPSIYKAVKVDVVFDNLKNKFIDATERAKEQLKKYEIDSSEEHYWNFKGINYFTAKAIEYLRSAEKEVIMHCHYDIRVFADEIKKLTKRGVRVIVFSFFKLDVHDLDIEYYHGTKFENTTFSMLEFMMIVDNCKVLMAYGQPGTFVNGIYSNNHYLIKTMSTYIHHDIYLFKMESKMNVNLIDDKTMINSLHEESIREETRRRDESTIRDYLKYR